MGTLATSLGKIFADAFKAAGLDPNLGQVRRSDKPELADFQCNGALAGAKAAKRNPREIAGEIVAAIAEQGLIESIEIAGPGFLNIRVNNDALADVAEETRGDRAMAGAQKSSCLLYTSDAADE